MRQTNSRERRRDREEFVYKNRHEINRLNKEWCTTHSNENALNWVRMEVRSELDYSCKTNDYDIFQSMLRTLRSLVEKEKVTDIARSEISMY
jgi:translation initiation factor 2B subunit (eIF-2B alpha/beta/delta family)